MAVRSTANQHNLSRYAFAISKRVGTAVVRNRIKRRLRECLRQLPILEGFDIVIVARQPASEADFQSLKVELTTLLKRSRLLASQE